MSEPTITREQLEAIRAWRKAGGYCGSGGVGSTVNRAAADAINALLAANPEPWEPSEQDCIDYCEARGWLPSPDDYDDYIHLAAGQLIDQRERGWDGVPRRLGSS